MDILQVVHAYPPQIGGIENHVYYLSKELAKLGNKVSVVTSGSGSGVEDGVSVTRHWSIGIPSFSSVKITPFLCLRLLLKSPCVYHSHGYGSLHPLPTAIAAKLKGKPFVFTLHGYPKLSSRWGKLLSWAYKTFIAKIFLSIADQVISVTDSNVPEISKEVDPAKITVIPNGVATGSFKPMQKIPTGYYDIVFIGRFDRDKGVIPLIKAFAEFSKTAEKAKLSFVGADEGMLSEMRATAKNLGVLDKVSFSSVKRDEMPGVYAKADLIVLPSYYEGLSLVVLESLSSQRPIIATAVGATPQVMQKAFGGEAGKFLVTPRDTKELIEKIRYHYEHREELKQLLPKARELILSDYSWESVAKQTLGIYEKAVKR